MATVTVPWSSIANGEILLRLIDNGDGSHSLDTTGSGGSPPAFAIENFTADGTGSYALADTPDSGTVILYVGGGNEIHFSIAANVLTEDTPSANGVQITITYFH